MGTPVTVDSDDLEALMNSAEFGAQVEALAIACQQDAALNRIRPRMRTAADRIRRARADAIRPHDDPMEDVPPTVIEKQSLLWLCDGPQIVDPKADSISNLVRKKLIVLGNGAMHWGDKTVEMDGSIWAKLTAKGEKLVPRPAQEAIGHG